MTSPNPELTEARVMIAALREEIDELRSDVNTILNSQADLTANLAKLIDSHNAVGENLQWLVANTQGIFQMFNNPQMMSQIMGQFMGGVSKVG